MKDDPKGSLEYFEKVSMVNIRLTNRSDYRFKMSLQIKGPNFKILCNSVN